MSALPVLPLRDLVVFPHSTVPLFIGRDKSLLALARAQTTASEILLVTQKNAKDNNPTVDTLSRVGVVCDIIQTVNFPDGTVKIMVEAKDIVEITSFQDTGSFFMAEFSVLRRNPPTSTEARALIKNLQTSFVELAKLNKSIPVEAINQVEGARLWSAVSYSIVANLNLKLETKLDLLKTVDAAELMEKILTILSGEIEVLKVEKKIQSRIKKNIEKSQKEYYLTEQMEAIQKELGTKDDATSELEDLFEKAKAKKLSAEAIEKVSRELKKLKQMNSMSSESTVSRNYVETILSLPWGDYSEENRDIAVAEEILERDHFGLEKAKEHILEQLAVMQMNPENRGTVLCLAGPPGVGKTSIAKSIAEAQGREFIRISLGGVRDEAEIRGHRRTYVGSMPGKIINALRKSSKGNPLILLDEIDKMGSDHKGDPASAMLEVLDPEQNHAFQDHYLELDYDLSKVLFFCTANYLENVPRPLLDRMEVIKLSGYTDLEKSAIATKYLIPKQIKSAGLENCGVEFTEDAVEKIISGYTKEAGVRGLERTFAKVCRKVARRAVSLKKSKIKNFVIKSDTVEKLLGPVKYKPEVIAAKNEIGSTNGMAWTEVGGTLLPIEVLLMPGKGTVTITGQLGDVMKESAQIAMAYVRNRAAAMGIDKEVFEKNDIHVHAPDGSTPKDGPSAGITLTTSLVSAVTKIPVRKDVAMTGEVSLLGKVMPIGGLKEKVIAAHKAGCRTIICPKDNERDLKDIPKEVRDDLKIICVEHVDEVLMRALDTKNPRELFKGLGNVSKRA